MLLSICIPTYNRGHLALKRVKEILGIDSQDIELIVSNNGSTERKEYYEQITSIQNPRLHYFEFEKNQGFVENTCQVIRLSRGDFCMLLSDEDSVIAENLPLYLDMIRHASRFTGDLFGNAWDTVGVIFGSLSTLRYTEANLTAGEESVKGAYMWGNYLSGLFFNRQVITNQVVDRMQQEYKDNIAWIYYPHLFFITASIIKNRTIMCRTPIVLKGENDRLESTIEGRKGKTCIEGEEFLLPLAYNAWEHRLEQMKGFCQHIRDLDVSDDIKFLMFCKVCQKTLHVMQCAKPGYLQSGAPWEKAMLALVRGMFEYLNEIDIAVVSQRRKLAQQNIIESVRRINGMIVHVL